MNKVEAELSEMVNEMTKAFLRNPLRQEFEEGGGDRNNKKLLSFFRDYFSEMAAKKEHEESIAITPTCTQRILTDVLCKNLSTVATVVGGKQKSLSSSVREIFSTADGPFIPQRTLREQLTQLKINITAFSEVVEVCRFLDQRQGCSTPFGAVNLIHFCAIYMTLCPVHKVYELVEMLFSSSDQRLQPLTDELRLKFFHLWAIIDASNRSIYEKLINACLDYQQKQKKKPTQDYASVLSIEILVELCPEIKNISSTAKQPIVAQDEEEGERRNPNEQQVEVVVISQGTKCISYSESDDVTAEQPVVTNSTSGGALGETSSSTKQQNNEGKVRHQEGQESKKGQQEEEEEEIQIPAEDLEFWKNLAS